MSMSHSTLNLSMIFFQIPNFLFSVTSIRLTVTVTVSMRFNVTVISVTISSIQFVYFNTHNTSF